MDFLTYDKLSYLTELVVNKAYGRWHSKTSITEPMMPYQSKKTSKNGKYTFAIAKQNNIVQVGVKDGNKNLVQFAYEL